MNPELLLVIGLLLACVGMFVVNKPRMDVVALLAIVVLPLCGLTSVPEALAGFSDPNIILIAALFVIGEGLVRTGIASKLGDLLVTRAGGNETRLVILLMLTAAGLGSVMSSRGGGYFYSSGARNRRTIVCPTGPLDDAFEFCRVNQRHAHPGSDCSKLGRG